MIITGKDLSAKNIAFLSGFVLFALLLNCGGAVFATKIQFPLYLDSIMTIGVTAIGGLIPGIICAVLSNGILYFLDYTMLPFMSCHILTALFAWLVFLHADKKNEPYEISTFLWAGVFSALSNAILGNFISDVLFGSRTNRQNIECTVHGIFVITRNLRYSTYLAGFIENITDKMLSAVLSYGLFEAAKRFLGKSLSSKI